MFVCSRRLLGTRLVQGHVPHTIQGCTRVILQNPKKNTRNSLASLKLPCGRRIPAYCAVSSDVSPVDVLVMVEAKSQRIRNSDIQAFAKKIEADAESLVQCALMSCTAQLSRRRTMNKPHELSIVLCDDEYMAAVNKEWRGKDSPTDVLSFEIPFDEFSMDLPVVTLGDIIISLETADRQAQERMELYGEQYTLYDEMRVLLVHGLLHLLGYDHELGPDATRVMADQESNLMQKMGWDGQGLIEAVSSSVLGSQVSAQCKESPKRSDVRLVCLDMDGTLLNSQSEISDETVSTLRRCLDIPNLTIMLATGKARPAAVRACERAGLAGPGGLVYSGGPGVFLQGLVNYGPDGVLLDGPSLPSEVVEACFEYSSQSKVSLCAFLGDTTVTTNMTPELQELHERYYEPLPQVESLQSIMQGLKVKKLLFMADPVRISNEVEVYINSLLVDSGAESIQAVDTMLEVVPKGVNKWNGVEQFLNQTGLEARDVLSIGDGMNDYHMLLHSGTAIAMGNAVPPVLDIADSVTETNDEHGVARALENYVLMAHYEE